MQGEAERWEKLVAFLANGPVMEPVVLPVARCTAGAIRAQLERTARRVRAFADELDSLVSGSELPVEGSTRGIALSLVCVCRTLAKNWCDGAPITDDRVREFNREVEFLRAMFDVPETRPAECSCPPHPPLLLTDGAGRMAVLTSCQAWRDQDRFPFGVGCGYSSTSPSVPGCRWRR